MCMLKPHCSKFIKITAIFTGILMFRILRYVGVFLFVVCVFFLISSHKHVVESPAKYLPADCFQQLSNTMVPERPTSNITTTFEID